jgi:hypothetical protein
MIPVNSHASVPHSVACPACWMILVLFVQVLAMQSARTAQQRGPSHTAPAMPHRPDLDAQRPGTAPEGGRRAVGNSFGSPAAVGMLDLLEVPAPIVDNSGVPAPLRASRGHTRPREDVSPGTAAALYCCVDLLHENACTNVLWTHMYGCPSTNHTCSCSESRAVCHVVGR